MYKFSADIFLPFISDSSLDPYHIRIGWLAKCDSTQLLLQKWWEAQTFELNYIPVLATEQQTGGFGQKSRSWESNSGSLLFSAILPVHPQLTWTSLEISEIICDFFNAQYQIQLGVKWPNDLIHPNGHKVGGILCYSMKNKVVVGVGLNLWEDSKNPILENCGYIFEQKENADDYKKKLLENLVIFICKKRHQRFTMTKDLWLKRCIHKNAYVSIIDGHETTSGVFVGLGDFGEAIVKEENGKSKNHTTGSLVIPSNVEF